MSRDSRDQYHYSSFGLIPRDWIQTPELRPEAQRLSESGPPSRVSSMRKLSHVVNALSCLFSIRSITLPIFLSTSAAAQPSCGPLLIHGSVSVAYFY